MKPLYVYKQTSILVLTTPFPFLPVCQDSQGIVHAVHLFFVEPPLLLCFYFIL